MAGDTHEEEPDGDGWTTDEGEEDWAKRFVEEQEEESPGDAADDEGEWPDNDDIFCGSGRNGSRHQGMVPPSTV